VKVKAENQTLATITLQNYFKLYKAGGHDRTAMTEAAEFWKIWLSSSPTFPPIARCGA
jgi:preprotein translocase subunit SecA